MIGINTLFSILIALLVFAFLIFIHELGHFLAARASGIRVNEFAIGMGPRLFKFQKGDTIYSLRAFPIGGFCSMEGESEESADENAYQRKPVWKRIIVTVAGAAMNLILGLILLVVINTAFTGEYLASTTIAAFDENSLPGQTGFQLGDRITSVNGTAVFVDYDIQFNILRDNDGIIDFEVMRDGQKVKLNGVQFNTQTGEDGRLYINGLGFKVEPIQKTVGSVLKQSALQTVSVARLIWLSVIDLITGNAGIDQMSGPVGITEAIGEAASGMSVNLKDGMYSLLMLTSLITINLGVFNLLPIPVLDGARLVFLTIEGIRRKPIPAKYEGMVQFIGIAALILLAIIVTYNDIARIISGG